VGCNSEALSVHAAPLLMCFQHKFVSCVLNVLLRFAYHISVVFECTHKALVPVHMLGVLLNNQHAHLLQTLCCYHNAPL
jgi:hypothetical protein